MTKEHNIISSLVWSCNRVILPKFLVFSLFSLSFLVNHSVIFPVYIRMHNTSIHLQLLIHLSYRLIQVRTNCRVKRWAKPTVCFFIARKVCFSYFFCSLWNRRIDSVLECWYPARVHDFTSHNKPIKWTAQCLVSWVNNHRRYITTER